MPSLKPHVSHATVVAYLALFVALGGSAYAAATIRGKDIVDGSITGADLRNNSVRSADVRGITGADLGPGAPWSLQSPDGRFSLAVTNSGVTMQGPASSVAVDEAGVTVQGTGRAEIRSAGTVQIQGTTIGLNGTCAPVANATRVFQHTHTAPEGGGATTPGTGTAPSFTNVFAC